MVSYAVWLLANDYTKTALLANTGDTRTWTRLYYRQVLNGCGACTLELAPNSPKISDLALMKRLLIYRDGTLVYGGLILGIGWEIGADGEETYTVRALDHAIYADWRIVTPSSGQEYDTRTDSADDVAKAYVRAHMGSGAAAGRQFSDLSVEADAGAVASHTEQARYVILLNLLQKLAEKVAFRWRFVPSATGCEFQTSAPPWGLDRTRGNGVNAEVIWSLDRRNVLEMEYIADLLEHYNYLYVAGQGEGVDRTVVERSNATAISAYGRRERLVDARHLSLTASLEARGDQALQEYAVIEDMTALPERDSWKVSWDLGDYVTISANRYGRTFSEDVEITAVNVEVSQEGVEHVRPELTTI